MKHFVIRDKEAGNIITKVDTLEEAKKLLAEFEEEDRKEGTFTADFYEIIEE